MNPTVWDGDPLCQHVWGDAGIIRRGGNNKPDNMPNVGANAYLQTTDLRGRGVSSGQFCQKCSAWFGCLGLEPSPEMYISHLVDIFREVRRVLRDDGTVWLNIGDSYGSSPGGYYPCGDFDRPSRSITRGKRQKRSHSVIKPKDLCLIPERLAIALQEDGWWIRCRIPWIKLNAMPSSQRDRPTVSHEYIFLMSKARKYYYDQEGVKLPHSRDWTNSGGTLTNAPRYASNPLIKGAAGEHRGSGPAQPSPSGRIRRTTDWWFDSLSDLFSDEFLAFVLPTEPFTMEMCKQCKQVYTRSEYNKLGVLIIPAEESDTGREQKKRICAGCGSTDDWLSHFATFGEKLVRPMVLAGTSPQACPHCGAGWIRQKQKTGSFQRRWSKNNAEGSPYNKQDSYQNIYESTGWQPTCSCENNDGSGRAIVLDPFAGSGTTCAVAKKLGRAYAGIEQNADYVRLSERRIEETEVETEEESKQLDLLQEAAGD